MTLTVPRHESNPIQVKCPICFGQATSYPTSGHYAIVDCQKCGGPYRVTDTATAMLGHKANRDVAVKRMSRVLSMWTRSDPAGGIPVVTGGDGFSLTFQGHKCYIVLPPCVVK